MSASPFDHVGLLNRRYDPEATKPSAGGRAWLLTPDTILRLYRAVASGIPVKTAVKIEGISETTYYRWLKIGKTAKEGIHREFYMAMDEAQARAETAVVSKFLRAVTRGVTTVTREIVKDENGDVVSDKTSEKTVGAADANSLKWWMERRYPQHFADPESRFRRSEAEDAEDDEAPSGFEIRIIRTDKPLPDDHQ